MKQPPPPESLSPHEIAAQTRRRRLPWPAALVWIAALGTTVAGATLFIRLLADRPVHEATVAGLFLRLDRVAKVTPRCEVGDLPLRETHLRA